MNITRISSCLAGLIVIALVVFASGCSRIAPAEAKARFEQGQRLERDGQDAEALEAYQAAANGRFEDQPQAIADMGRLADKLNKDNVAVQAYTMLARQHAKARVNAAPPGEPEDIRVVGEWIGSPGRQNPDGPLYALQQEMDRKNSGKIWYRVMDTLVAATGRNPWYSYALALFVFTLVVKLLMTPLTNQQFHSMRKMTAIQPKMKEIQDRLKDKPEEMNRAVMQLYRDEGVNPMGCAGGMLIQFPILIGLYSLIRMYQFQFKNGYFLWINPETHQLAPGIVGSSLAQPDIILLVLYAISMYVSQRITVVPSQDPQQRQQQMMMAYMMPVMFLFVLKDFPSAFILYWLMFNVLTTWQQRRLMHLNPMEAPALAAPTPTSVPAPEAAPRKTGGPARSKAKRRKR